MRIVLVDTNWKKFLPLTFTRPVGEIRIGVLKIREKWEYFLNSKSELVSEEYLNKKYFQSFEGGAIVINSKVLPNLSLANSILNLKDKEMLSYNNEWVAIKSDNGFNDKSWEGLKTIQFKGEMVQLNNWWDIYLKNGDQIELDFSLITRNRESKPISATNTIIGDASKIFLEDGVYLEGCTLNTNHGSIYFGKNSEIMEGALIRGGLAVLEESRLKLGVKIYGPTTIGPKSRIGGEVKNCVIQGHSNKSHDGYIGNSVLGEWINLGADTNCSNLKNTFSNAKVWDYETGDYIDSKQQFIGACIGDYSKTGINTMINTASTIGVNVNWFGEGFPPKRIPSFQWGKDGKGDVELCWNVNKNIAKMNSELLTVMDYKILKNVQLIDSKSGSN